MRQAFCRVDDITDSPLYRSHCKRHTSLTHRREGTGGFHANTTHSQYLYMFQHLDSLRGQQLFLYRIDGTHALSDHEQGLSYSRWTQLAALQRMVLKPMCVTFRSGYMWHPQKPVGGSRGLLYATPELRLLHCQRQEIAGQLHQTAHNLQMERCH